MFGERNEETYLHQVLVYRDHAEGFAYSHHVFQRIEVFVSLSVVDVQACEQNSHDNLDSRYYRKATENKVSNIYET